jgi:uncharacterized protein with HEPN domain
MVNKIQTWLLDVDQSIDEIFQFLPNPRDFNVYKNDIKTKKAVERNLEIIGEAIRRILELDYQISIENARNIVNTRNRIIHGYDSISDEVIWTIVTRELPKLKSEIQSLLNI